MIVSQGYLGDVAAGATVDFKFFTLDGSALGTGSGVTLSGGAVSAYKTNSTTESTAGITLTLDFDGRTGMHHVRITTGSDGTFYAAGVDITVAVTAGTVSGVDHIGYTVASFSIRNRPVDVGAISGDDAAADNLETMLDATGGGVLSLGQLNIVASSNNPAIVATGAGTGAGIQATGGATGQGIKAAGGATSGAGVLAIGSNGNANGMTLTGQGSAAGLQITGGATGHGLIALGGATSGNGIRAAASNSGDGMSFVGATNGHGMNVTGAGTGEGISATGGATGHGIEAIGGGTSGDGIKASVTGAANNGMTLAGGASGVGLSTTFVAALLTSIADALLKRDMSAVTGESARSPLNALRLLRNKWSVSGVTLTVTKEDDTTSAWTSTLTTDATADFVTGSDPA